MLPSFQCASKLLGDEHPEWFRELHRLPHQSIESSHIRRIAELLRQRSAGTQTHLIDQTDQPFGSAFVSKLRVSKIHLTKTFCMSHTRPSVNNRAGYQSVTGSHPRTIKFLPIACASTARQNKPAQSFLSDSNLHPRCVNSAMLTKTNSCKSKIRH